MGEISQAIWSVRCRSRRGDKFLLNCSWLFSFALFLFICLSILVICLYLLIWYFEYFIFNYGRSEDSQNSENSEDSGSDSGSGIRYFPTYPLKPSSHLSAPEKRNRTSTGCDIIYSSILSETQCHDRHVCAGNTRKFCGSTQRNESNEQHIQDIYSVYSDVKTIDVLLYVDDLQLIVTKSDFSGVWKHFVSDGNSYGKVLSFNSIETGLFVLTSVAREEFLPHHPSITPRLLKLWRWCVEDKQYIQIVNCFQINS